mgnify:FL=1
MLVFILHVLLFNLGLSQNYHEKSAMRNQMKPDSASLAALKFMFMVANVIARVKSPSEVKSAVKMFTEPLLKIQSFS